MFDDGETLVGEEDHEEQYIGDGEWVVRSHIKGSHEQPGTRRLVARRLDSGEMALVEQRLLNEHNEREKEWDDVEVRARFVVSSVGDLAIQHGGDA